MSDIKLISEMTVDEFRRLLNEYYAIPEKRTKMTNEEVFDLAHRLNQKFNIPIISEIGEEKIAIKIIFTIDGFLYDHLPNEIYDLIRSVDKGISDEEAKRLIKRLATLANEKINIPYIPESLEYVIFNFVIGIIINASRRKWDLTKAAKAFSETTVKNLSKVSAKDNNLEALILAG